MPKIRLMKRTHGDECLCEWDEKVELTFSDARANFASGMEKGRMAFRMTSPGVQELITEFDPTLEGDILIVPAIQGG